MIILFAHQKGGVGKSTLAINLSYMMKCPIIDLDSQNSSMLFNQIRNMNKMETLECLIPKNIAELDTITKKYKSNKNNLIVIDSGGYDSQINRFTLANADLIITPVGISQIEIFGLQKFRNILKEASNILGRIIKTNVVINNVDIRSKKRINELKEYIKGDSIYFNLLDSIVYSRSDFKLTYSKGLTIEEFNRKGKAFKEILSFANEIKHLIE